MRTVFSLAAVGVWATLSSPSSLQAQNIARLRVSVNVVPAVTAQTVQPTPIITDISQDVQFSRGIKQQSHVITRIANSAELDNTWLAPVNPSGPSGTKVLYDGRIAPPCEITISTVEFVTE